MSGETGLLFEGEVELRYNINSCERKAASGASVKPSFQLIVAAAALLVFAAPVVADDEVEVRGSDYRVAVGPPGPRVKDDAPLSPQELAAMEYEKTYRKIPPGTPWALEVLPYGVSERVYGAVALKGGTENSEYLASGYCDSIPEHVTDWAEKHRTISIGPLEAEITDNARCKNLKRKQENAADLSFNKE